jgi:hypothetical protein
MLEMRRYMPFGSRLLLRLKIAADFRPIRRFMATYMLINQVLGVTYYYLSTARLRALWYRRRGRGMHNFVIRELVSCALAWAFLEADNLVWYAGLGSCYGGSTC